MKKFLKLFGIEFSTRAEVMEFKAKQRAKPIIYLNNKIEQLEKRINELEQSINK